MKTFISDNFLLRTRTAQRLYHDHAANQPIFDYHCHLPPQQIAENYQFKNLYDVWLAGDHYKWRAMRSNGVAEKYCTGDASDYDKYLAFAKAVPETLRNPMYHWTHLELLRYFKIDDLLDETSAPDIWKRGNELLALKEYSTQGLIERSKVTVICTTDDPTDDLASHRKIKSDGKLRTRVYPTFRPDKFLTVNQPDIFKQWVQKLENISKVDCSNLSGFMKALDNRHQAFHDQGGRLSDHGLSVCPGQFATEKQAAEIYKSALGGKAATVDEWEKFSGFLMVYFGQLDSKRKWVKQIHLGALRNNNSRLFKAIGPDAGFDSIGDWNHASNLSRYLDALDSENSLPKTIIYNLNPADNYMIGTMIGNFQDGSVPGKIQFGSGWWFLDQKEGMEMQINALSNLGLLSRFVGMLTDSRSFLSYIRHEYFRRILCNLLGNDVENGELPNDPKLLGNLVENICYKNASNYFGLEEGKL